MQIYLSQTTDFGNHFTLLRDVPILLVLQTVLGQIQDFSRWGGGGRGRWLVPWGCRNQCGHASKMLQFENWVNLKLLTRHTSNTTNEKLLWGICPECLPLFLPSNLFQFFLFFKRGVASHPIQPRPNPKSAPDGSSIRESNQAKNKLFQTKRNYCFQTQNRLMRYVQIFVKIHWQCYSPRYFYAYL